MVLKQKLPTMVKSDGFTITKILMVLKQDNCPTRTNLSFTITKILMVLKLYKYTLTQN